MYALCDADIFDGENLLYKHALVIDGEHIHSLVPQRRLNREIQRIDCQGMLICPGFIDLQLNGCGGVMLNGNVNAHTIEQMHKANLRSATTSFLPTLITTSDEEMDSAIALMASYPKQQSHCLGLHLEGPYLSLARKGIHNGAYIRILSTERLYHLVKHASHIRMLTLAPEHVSNEHIRALTQAGIVVALGHSEASFEQCEQAFEAGLKAATHLYNAMPPLSGRQSGPLGAIFEHALPCGVIADGHHVAYSNIRLAKTLLGEKLFLVTDATAAANSDIDHFDFVGTPIDVVDGRCLGPDGTLGGSALTMIEAVRNVISHCHIELTEALRMASLYPAKLINEDHRLGRIKAGYVANLALLSDELEVCACISDGHYHTFN